MTQGRRRVKHWWTCLPPLLFVSLRGSPAPGVEGGRGRRGEGMQGLDNSAPGKPHVVLHDVQGIVKKLGNLASL